MTAMSIGTTGRQGRETSVKPVEDEIDSYDDTVHALHRGRFVIDLSSSVGPDEPDDGDAVVKVWDQMPPAAGRLDDMDQIAELKRLQVVSHEIFWEVTNDFANDAPLHPGYVRKEGQIRPQPTDSALPTWFGSGEEFDFETEIKTTGGAFHVSGSIDENSFVDSLCSSVHADGNPALAETTVSADIAFGDAAQAYGGGGNTHILTNPVDIDFRERYGRGPYATSEAKMQNIGLLEYFDVPGGRIHVRNVTKTEWDIFNLERPLLDIGPLTEA